MALVKLNDVAPNRQGSDRDTVSFDSFEVYTTSDDKVGSVKDVLIDEHDGLFRYLIVDTGLWVFGKTILLPIGLARFDFDARRVYVDGLTQEQVEHLPEFTNDLKIDQDYEERVRGVYRPLVANRGSQAVGTTYNRDTYRYDQDPYLYNRSAAAGDRLSAYEQRFSRTPR